MAIVNALKNAVLVGLDAEPVGTNPNPWIPIVPSQADDALNKAVADLPPNGGVLYVMPGEDMEPYVFTEAVVIDKPNVTIRFGMGPRDQGPGVSGSYLTFPSTGGPSALFRIERENFKCYGAYVRYTATNGGGGTADDHRACFLVTGAAVTTDGALFDECTFEVEQAPLVQIVDFFCIRALGTDAMVPRRGLRVSNCWFLFRPGGRQLAAWSGVDPLGVGGIRATNSAETIVSKAIFRGVTDVPRGTCATSILLENSPSSILTDLVFRALELVPSTEDEVSGSIVRIDRAGGLGGHATVMARFSFEQNDARYMIELVDPLSTVVTDGNFGRLVDTCEAGVLSRGPLGRALVVRGLNLHNVKGVASPLRFSRMIDLQEIDGATISGIVFKPFASDEIPIGVQPGGCRNVFVEQDQASIVF